MKITKHFFFQLSTEVIQNKNQSYTTSSAQKPFLKSNIHISWKHRKYFNSDYGTMGTIGPTIKTVLDGNKDYTIDELKDVMLKAYVTNENRYFFDNSFVTIGTQDGLAIIKFIGTEEEECTFWEYSKIVLRKKFHHLKIYLLTTSLNLDKYKTRHNSLEDQLLKKKTTGTFTKFGG